MFHQVFLRLFGTAIDLYLETTLKNNKMKKLIVSIVMLVPFISFAQNSISEKINGATESTNPFAQIVNENQVSQEYLDIVQTAAILDISNTQPRSRGESTGSTSIPSSLVNLNTLTNGLQPANNARGSMTLTSIFEK